ncbi:MAG: GNAT family N-acetyltransferase [Bacteroidota bacterium]|nr:GNAT family N-acetyltransferase [Bacteroidota bacterium]
MNFKLRPFNAHDSASLVKYANNYRIAQFMTNQFPHPYTEESARAFINFATRDNPLHIFAIDIDGQSVGGIGIHPQSDIYSKNAELGYWLAEPFWGKGIITEAVRQMVTYGFKNFDVTRIFARPFGTNSASQKVLEKAGFKLEAKLENTLFKNGEFIDELIYAKRLKDL